MEQYSAKPADPAGPDDPAGSPSRRRSALPWPDLVRSGPGRWTLVASAALMVLLATGALVIVMIRM